MNAITTPRMLFRNSLDRCTQSDTFIHDFYSRFVASSEDVRLKFRNTNFERQHRMLLSSLRMIGNATDGDPSALQEIRDRAESHCRSRLDIPPHMYTLWKDALMETARLHDPLWASETATAWDIILGHAIACMVRRY